VKSPIKIGPQLVWPRFPDFPAHYYKAERMQLPMRANRYFYDWTAFTPEGLPHAEAHWQLGTELLASLLPERFAVNPRQWSGINFGTFTGAYQKAWMRRGYTMYGIELQNVIDDLNAYGCEGRCENVYDLSTIADARFDFGVLDRVFCQRDFYEKFEARARKRGNAAQSHFANIKRVLKGSGAFIGVLYDWFSPPIVAELAGLGGLKLWPMNMDRVAFCVDLSLPATDIPNPLQENFGSPCFVDVQIGGQATKLFLPTNEIVTEREGRRTVSFAPPLRRPKSGSKRALPVDGAAGSIGTRRD
jgi:hypothetical protein